MTKIRILFFCLCWIVVSFWLSLNTFALAQNSQNELERKKAQVIYNLALFVTWPKTSFSNPDASFYICLLGTASTEFRNALSELAAKKSVKGQPVKFLEVQQLDSHETCHIAFIGSEVVEPKLEELLESLHQRSILTISDRQEFAEFGGIIGLLQMGQRVRFGINLDAAEQAKLSIRAQLLVMSGTSLLGKHVPKKITQP